MSKIILLVFVVFIAFSFVDVSVAKHQQENEKVLKTYELKKGNFSVKFTNLGASIMSLVFPDKAGKLADVVLGFDSAEEYKENAPYFGAIIGRVSNRIAGAKFKLNGITYKLDANEGNNTLHGGKKGFSHVIWRARQRNNVISFYYTSHDGEEGFPGVLAVSVTYMLLGHQQLSVTMKAIARNKPTPVSLAQHTYWNLGGHNSGDILSHEVQLFASHITPTDEFFIPTGKFVHVKGTPYDFLKPHTIGSRINLVPHCGYDINYVIDKSWEDVKNVAIVHDGKSGRAMELWTTAPAMLFYTGNRLNVKGKGGYVYKPYGGLALETQGFPDAVNHPNFPSVIVSPGKPYQHSMLFKFSTK